VEPSQNDGKFEVIGMTGVTMAKIHSGAGHAIRICQCSTAELTTKRSLPFQQDGEGCMLQGPSVVHVSLKNQATVLCTAKGRYKDLLGTDYEFDTKYRLVNLYYVPVNSQNRSTTIEHVRSVMMPLNATLAEVRSSHVDAEVRSGTSASNGAPWRYLRYFPKAQVGEGIYRTVSDEEEQTLRVSQFAKSDGRVKSGLFIACLANDQRLSESIFESAATGNISQVQELYAKDSALVDQYGRSPLHVAAENGQLAAAMLFLNEYADSPTAVDHKGRTPLHGAAAAGYVNIVEQLLVHHADSSIRDHDGLTAADLAARDNQQAVVAVLQEAAKRESAA